MFVYAIPMRFRYGSGIDYGKFDRELKEAHKRYNNRFEKIKKARKITKIKLEEDGFTIFLESGDKLTSPFKALAVFSHDLAKMESLTEFLDLEKHLLCNNGRAKKIESDEAMFDDSTGAILKTVIDIFMTTDVSDSAFVSSGRKKAQKKSLKFAEILKI